MGFTRGKPATSGSASGPRSARICFSPSRRWMSAAGCVINLYCFFFFQAEDGIRDSSVTGVQTCALPISSFNQSLYDQTQAVSVTSKNTIDTTKGGNRFNGLVRAGSGVPADQLQRIPNGNSPQVLAVPAGAPRGFYDAENLFAPRFGFSYSPFTDHLTAIRG